jgi:hypothetical protein
MEDEKMNKIKVILLISAWLLIPYIMLPLLIWNRCKYNKFTWAFLSGCITFVLYFAIFINPGIQENKMVNQNKYTKEQKKIAKHIVDKYKKENKIILETSKPTIKEYVKKTTEPPTIKPTIKPTVKPTSRSKEYIVTFKFADLVENNHVGNEWGYSLDINGKTLCLGQKVTLNSKSLTCKAAVVEHDSIPDKNLTTDKLKLGDNYISVIVTENRGRYSGNTATWQFTINVKER